MNRAVLFGVLITLSSVMIRRCIGEGTGKPKVQPFLFPSDLTPGKSAAVVCSLSEGMKPIQQRWLKDGKELKLKSNIKVNQVDHLSTLLIDPIEIGDEGNYTCVVQNVQGSDSYTSKMDIQVPPKWIIEPIDSTGTIHSSVTLHCAADGIPLPNIKWLRVDQNGQAIPNVKGTQRRNMNNSTLYIESVKTDDRGQYECQASNGVGTILRKLITLNVQVPAKFEEKFSVVTVRRAESAKLVCEAMGDQPLTLMWKKDIKLLNKTRNDRFETYETMTSNGVRSELVIRSAEREDGGLYLCLAENQYGKDERSIKVLVLEVPGSPLDVRLREAWSRTASVTWAAPYSGNSPITKYIVQYWMDHGKSHRLNEHTVGSSQTTALIKDLHPGSSYVLAVVAENEVGRGEPSETIKFKTGEEEPSGSPLDITVEGRGPSTVRVTWRSPPKDQWNGQLKGFYVGYKAHDYSQPYTYRTVDFHPNGSHEFFLTNLLKATEYIIVVKAFNGAGSGPPSQEMLARTLTGDLPSSPMLFILATSSNSVTLAWRPKRRDVPITGYTLHYKKKHDRWREISLPANSENSYTLKDLDSDSQYELYVTATNKYGGGDPSAIVLVKTGGAGATVSATADGLPPYVDTTLLISAGAAIIAILVVITTACLCVHRIKQKGNPAVGDPSKHQMYSTGSHRYVDIDKARPLMNCDGGTPDHYPAPYETIPMRDDLPDNVKEDLRREMKSFLAQKPWERPLPQPQPQAQQQPPQPQQPTSLKRKTDPHVYDSPQ